MKKKTGRSTSLSEKYKINVSPTSKKKPLLVAVTANGYESVFEFQSVKKAREFVEHITAKFLIDDLICSGFKMKEVK